MRWVVALALLLAAARPAAARPKIPKVLEDVAVDKDGGPDRDGYYVDGSYELVSFTIDPKLKKLGGRRVIAFVHRYRIGVRRGDAETVDEAELAIIDAETKEYALSVTIEAQGRTYDWSWVDIDRDGELELQIDLEEGDVDEVWPRQRIQQLRYGAYLDVGLEGAKCGRQEDDKVELGAAPDSTLQKAALDRLRRDLDEGNTTGRIHCDLVDAVAAMPRAHYDFEPLAWPELGAPIALSPVAYDCPALAWVERRGLVLDPPRAGVFISNDHRISFVTIDADEISVRTMGDRAAPVGWWQTWVLDDHLYLFAEQTVEKKRRAVVIDVVAQTMDFSDDLRESETAIVEIASGEVSKISLVATDAVDKRTLWTRRVRTWSP